jgi:hypothetical protein
MVTIIASYAAFLTMGPVLQERRKQLCQGAPRDDQYQSPCLTAGKDAKEQEKLYAEQTGAGRADFYRRKYEIEHGDFEEHDAA